MLPRWVKLFALRAEASVAVAKRLAMTRVLRRSLVETLQAASASNDPGAVVLAVFEASRIAGVLSSELAAIAATLDSRRERDNLRHSG